MIDVGQGDCFYLETNRGNVILIDTGGSETGDYDVGEAVVLPYLLHKGKTSIDTIIISHPHKDHIGGVYTLLKKLKVKNVVIGKHLENEDLVKNMLLVCQEKNINVITVEKGNQFFIDDICFKVLYPDSKVKDENLNQLSLVIKMEYAGFSCLFTGDLEDVTDNLGRFAENVDILKVGHHGSKTSTSDELLRNTTPQIALISVGKKNGYGHPDKATLARLERAHVKIYRTDQSGEVMVKISRAGMKVKPLQIK